MKGIKKEEHYGEMVWTNVKMDKLRRKECLCLNCEKAGDNCFTASMLYSMCKEKDLAIMITRCPKYKGTKGV